MNAKAKPSHRTWVDPDDAPELTDEWIEQAELRDGDKIVRHGRRVDSAKTPTTKCPTHSALLERRAGGLAQDASGGRVRGLGFDPRGDARKQAGME
jgi:hypothetical protein